MRLASGHIDCTSREGTCGGFVWLLDVRRNRRRVVAMLDPTQPATDLVLTQNLAVAWIRPGGGGHEVVKSDSAGLATLDAGAGVEPGSLATVSRRLYWTNAGQPRSYDTG